MVTLNVVPDDNPYSKLLLGKCIRRVDKLKSFGIEKFLNDCIDDLANNRFEKDYYQEIDFEQLSPLIEAFKLLYKQTINLKLTKEQFQEDMNALGVSEESSPIIWSVVDARRHEIHKSLENQHTYLNNRYLIDFDWKLHLSLSSDSKALQRKPFLLLSLKIGSQHEGGQSKTVIIEMTKEELDEFITSLEEVEKEVASLRT